MPLSSRKEEPRVTDDVAAAVTKPFSELNHHEKDKRWTHAIDYNFTSVDQGYINSTAGENETNKLFRSWVDVSFFLIFRPTPFNLYLSNCGFFLLTVLRLVDQCCPKPSSLGRGAR